MCKKILRQIIFWGKHLGQGSCEKKRAMPSTFSTKEKNAKGKNFHTFRTPTRGRETRVFKSSRTSRYHPGFQHSSQPASKTKIPLAKDRLHDYKIRGHLQNFIYIWKKSTANCWALSIEEDGYKIEFLSVFILSAVTEIRTKTYHRKQSSTSPSNQFREFNLLIGPKKSGNWRVIFNLRNIEL